MIAILEAGFIVIRNEDGLVLVGFADKEIEPTSYLTLQRPELYDKQDVALGMNQVHLEWDDPSQSIYGGIKKVVLYRDRVVIDLEEATASKLKASRQIEVRFSIADAELDRVRQGLACLFMGTSFLEDQTA